MRRISPALIAVALFLAVLVPTPALADGPDCFPYETTSAWSDPLGLDEPVVAIAGSEGLLACATAARLFLVDVTDPAAPAVLGSTDLAAPATVLAICGTHVVAGGQLAHLYDIADPTTPMLVATENLLSTVRDLAAGPHWLAAVTDHGALHVWRRPLDPAFVADWTVSAAGHVHGVAAWQERLVAAADELVVLAVPAAGEPGTPVVERSFRPVPEPYWGRPLDLAVAGDVALVSFEWWIPVAAPAAGHRVDGGDERPQAAGRDEPLEPALLVGVDLAATADPGQHPASYRQLMHAPRPALASTGTALAVAGESLLVCTPDALLAGPWLQPALAFPSDLETRLAGAGSLLARLDGGVVRLLPTAPVVAADPLVQSPAVRRGRLLGRWTTHDTADHPLQTVYERQLLYHEDPRAPRLVATFSMVDHLELGHGAQLVAADGALAVVEIYDATGPFARQLHDGSLPDPAPVPLDVPMEELALSGPRLVAAAGGDLVCVDLADPAAPQDAGSLALGAGGIVRLEFLDPHHVLAWTHAHWATVDVSDLDAPQLVAMAPRAGGPLGVANGLVFTRDDGGTMSIHDLQLQLVGQVSGQGFASAMASRGDLVAVAWRDEGVDLVDLSDPGQPTRLQRTVDPGGQYVYGLGFGEPASGGEVVHLAMGRNGVQVALLHPAAGGRILGGVGEDATALTVTDVGVLMPRSSWPLQCGVITATGPQVPAAARPLLTVAPNPFNPRTSIRFAVPRPGPATLSLLDLRGRLVRRLADGDLAAGQHTRVWDGTDRHGRPVSAGVYLLQLRTSGGVATGRLALVR